MVKEGHKKNRIQAAKARNAMLSNHRSSFCKQALELCVRCTMEMAVAIFKPNDGKPCSFGSPFVGTREDGPHIDAHTRELRRNQSLLLTHLHFQMGKERMKQLAAIPIDKMNRDQILELRACLEDYEREISERLAKKIESPISSKDSSTSSNNQLVGFDSSVDDHNGNSSK